MQNGSDLSHVGKLIDQYTADAKYARQQATNQRMTADQHYRDGDSPNAAYYEKEAVRFERQADEYENHVDELHTQKTRLEERLKDLENQRTHVAREHEDRLRQLEKEIADVRGSGMML